MSCLNLSSGGTKDEENGFALYLTTSPIYAEEGQLYVEVFEKGNIAALCLSPDEITQVKWFLNRNFPDTGP